MKKMLAYIVFVCLIFVISNGLFGVDGDEVKSVSVMEGDSVTLHTDVTELQRYNQIQWIDKSQALIAEINTQDESSSICDLRFNDKLQLDSQTGSLTITNIRISDSGLYKVKMIGNDITSKKRFNVTVYAPLPVPVITRISNTSNCSSSSERSSVCVLLCSVLNVSHVSLSWYKGSSLLSSISVSDLNIRLSLPLEVDYEDNSTYTCVLNNPLTNHTQQLHINEVCRCPASKWPCIVLALILILVLICGIFWKIRQSRASAEHDNSDCTKEQKSLLKNPESSKTISY